MNATAGMRWRPPSPGGSKIPNLTQPQQHCGDQGYANKHDFMLAVYRQHKPKGTQLSQTGVSDNVDCVKHFVGVLTRALRRARHFALVEALPYQPRLARNRFRSGTQSDPCISSVTTSIMITTSNSPVKESGIPNQLLGVQLHTIACSGLSRVRTEFRQLLVIPSLAPYPVKTNGESTGDFGILTWSTSAVCFGPPWAQQTSTLDLSVSLDLEAGVGLESQGGAIRADSVGI